MKKYFEFHGLSLALSGIGLFCVFLLSFGIYLQEVQGLVPCPMCIVQRYCLMAVAIVVGAATFFHGSYQRCLIGAGVLFSAAGAATALRQSWLQLNPPEFSSCGRDFFGMITDLPLNSALPLIFSGTGDCSKIDWTFLGGSIANWSLLIFIGFAFGLVLIYRKLKG